MARTRAGPSAVVFTEDDGAMDEEDETGDLSFQPFSPPTLTSAFKDCYPFKHRKPRKPLQEWALYKAKKTDEDGAQNEDGGQDEDSYSDYDPNNDE